MRYKLIIIAILILFASNTLYAQQKVTYNGKTFKKPEVVEADIGRFGESFGLRFSEIDMYPGGSWAKEKKRLEDMGKVIKPSDIPDNKVLLFSVEFNHKFKFPIKPSDSVYVSLSDVMETIQEHDFNDNERSKMDMDKITSEGESMKAKQEVINKEMAILSKKMKEGKISPMEFAEKIEALNKPLIEEVDNSYAMSIESETYEEPPNYSFFYSDSGESIEADVINGTLHIVEFNKDRLVAYIKGKHIVKCAGTKNTASRNCKKPSNLMPGYEVLDEGEVYISINTTFNEFIDNRN